MVKKLPPGMHEGDNLYLVIMKVCADDWEDIWEERQFAVRANNPCEAVEKIKRRITEDEKRTWVTRTGYTGIFEIGDITVINIEDNTLKRLVFLQWAWTRKSRRNQRRLSDG
ncbi:MAG: hypothetical protein H0Z24_06655 [Thermosipho sp. (in: Bacteria)]|nr:hypothetical protein [Thermosipho sp. (in: thermotogales)]